MSFAIRSPAFSDGKEVPVRHTCEGDDVSPPLEWTDPPKGTKSLALIVDDPDAPDPKAPRMTWVHWVVYRLPPAAGALPEGARESALPGEARFGLNDWKRAAYGGRVHRSAGIATSTGCMPSTWRWTTWVPPPRQSSRRPSKDTCSRGPSWWGPIAR